MKKIYLFLLIIAGGYGVSAQSIKFGPEIGLEATTLIQKVDDKEYNSGYLGGFRIGVATDIPLYQGDFSFWCFQPSIQFRGFSGGRTNNTTYDKFGNGFPTAVEDERTYHLYRLHIPAYFTYKMRGFYEDNFFTLSAGPYFTANIGGNFSRSYITKLNGSDRPVYEDHEMKIGNTLTEHDIRRFDVGAAVAVGYEMSNGMNVKLFYEYGFLNLSPQGLHGYNTQSHGGGISLAYYFNKDIY